MQLRARVSVLACAAPRESRRARRPWGPESNHPFTQRRPHALTREAPITATAASGGTWEKCLASSLALGRVQGLVQAPGGFRVTRVAPRAARLPAAQDPAPTAAAAVQGGGGTAMPRANHTARAPTSK